MGQTGVDRRWGTLVVGFSVAVVSCLGGDPPIDRDVQDVAVVSRALTASALDPVAFCRASGLNVIIGDSNNNVLTGTPGADCIVGLGGQDVSNGNGGGDIIFGGDGDDVINGCR